MWVYHPAGAAITRSILANSLRSIVIAVTATSFFFALGRLPFANCAALTFLSPLFVALFGAAFLKEELSPRIGLALGSASSA